MEDKRISRKDRQGQRKAKPSNANTKPYNFSYGIWGCAWIHCVWEDFGPSNFVANSTCELCFGPAPPYTCSLAQKITRDPGIFLMLESPLKLRFHLPNFLSWLLGAKSATQYLVSTSFRNLGLDVCDLVTPQLAYSWNQHHRRNAPESLRLRCGLGLPFCHSCSRFFMPVWLNLSKHICGELFWSTEHLWHFLSSLPLLSRGYLFPSWSIERVWSCHCFNAKLVVYLWEASIFNVTALSSPASPASLNVFTVLSDYIVSIFSVQLLLSFYVDLHENNKP